MKIRNEREILMERIVILNQKQEDDLQRLKDQYHVTIDSFKTMNIIKTSIQEVMSMPNLSSNIVRGAFNLGTQYLSNTFLKEDSKKAPTWLGRLTQFALKKLR